jgi:hypothetical protein
MNRAEEIASALRRMDLSAPRAFPGMLTAIRELLSAERAVAYALRPGEGCHWFHAEGNDASRARLTIPRFLDSRSDGWSGISYHPNLSRPFANDMHGQQGIHNNGPLLR